MAASRNALTTTTTLTIGVMGDSNTGKTSLIHALMQLPLQQNIQPTYASAFYKKELSIDNNHYQLDIIDTSGNPRYQQQFIPSYLKNCDAILIAYDRSNISSLESIEQRIKEVNKPDGFPFILVGTKSDSPTCVVSLNDAKAKARELGLDENLCFEVNARESDNLTAPFVAAVKKALTQGRGKTIAPQSNTSETTLSSTPSFIARLRKYLTENSRKVALTCSIVLLSIVAIALISAFLWPVIAGAAVIGGIAAVALSLSTPMVIACVAATVVAIASLVLENIFGDHAPKATPAKSAASKSRTFLSLQATSRLDQPDRPLARIAAQIVTGNNSTSPLAESAVSEHLRPSNARRR